MRKANLSHRNVLYYSHIFALHKRCYHNYFEKTYSNSSGYNVNADPNLEIFEFIIHLIPSYPSTVSPKKDLNTIYRERSTLVL